eukprot:scaffold8074_cov444-Prasinococcus_capsulatus_cf.AAC.2
MIESWWPTCGQGVRGGRNGSGAERGSGARMGQERAPRCGFSARRRSTALPAGAKASELDRSVAPAVSGTTACLTGVLG